MKRAYACGSAVIRVRQALLKLRHEPSTPGYLDTQYGKPCRG